MNSTKVSNGKIQKVKKQIPQHLNIRCGMTHLYHSSKKLGRTFKLQKEFLKTKMNLDEIDENVYMNKKDEWLEYDENDVLCTAFSYVRYKKAMEDIT